MILTLQQLFGTIYRAGLVENIRPEESFCIEFGRGADSRLFDHFFVDRVDGGDLLIAVESSGTVGAIEF